MLGPRRPLAVSLVFFCMNKWLIVMTFDLMHNNRLVCRGDAFINYRFDPMGRLFVHRDLVKQKVSWFDFIQI